MVTLLKRRMISLREEVNDLVGAVRQLPPIPAAIPGQPKVELAEVEGVLHVWEDREQELASRRQDMLNLEEQGSKLIEKGTKAEQEANERLYVQHLADISWEDVIKEGRKARRTMQTSIAKLLRRKGELIAAIPVEPPVQMPPQANDAPPAAPVHNSMIALPPLKLRPFSGKLRDWQLFYEQFMSSIDKLQIDSVDKFNYLLSFLEGEAKAVVKGLMPTAGNYRVALDLLKDKYDDQDSFSGELIEKFNGLKACRHFADVRQFQIDLEAICRQLESLGEDLNSAIICSSLENKLTFPFLREIRKAKKLDRNWNTERFRRKLAELVKEEESSQRAYYLQHSSSSNSERKPRSDQRDSRKVNRDRSPNLTFVTQSKSKSQRVKFRDQGPSRSPSGSPSQIRNSPARSPNSSRDPTPVSSRSPSPRPKFASGPPSPCALCAGSHWMAECTRYRSYTDRINRVRNLRLCTKCLRTNHDTQPCPAPKFCSHCKGKHPKALCKGFIDHNSRSPSPRRPPTPPSSGKPRSPSPVQQKANSVLSSSVFTKETLYMCTENWVYNPADLNRRTRVTIIWDSCSGISYIRSALAKQLQLPVCGTESVDVYPAFARSPLKEKYLISPVCIAPIDNTPFQYWTDLRQTQCITKETSVVKFSPLDQKIWDMSLSFPRQFKEPDILLGLKDYNRLRVLPITVLPSGFALYYSMLGSFICGEGLVSVNPNQYHVSNSILNNTITSNSPEFEEPIVAKGRGDNDLNKLVEQQLSLDSAGLADCEENPSDEILLEDFMANLTRDDEGRYETRLLWNERKAILPLNIGLARGRLRSTLKSLRVKPDILALYHQTIMDQLEKGIIELVDNTQDNRPGTHYLAHQAVVRAHKEHTKVRVVYDGSAHVRGTNSPSLNECLLKGPLLLEDLAGVLMRFRLMDTAIGADIEKAFLQIKIAPEHRDSTRFFWPADPLDTSQDDKPQVYRFTRVLFGLTCSPFLLAGTVRAHLKSYPDSVVAKSILENIYVDNVIMDVPDGATPLRVITEAMKIFEDAKMNLREVTSNDRTLLSLLPEEKILKQREVKILGMRWDTEFDWLRISLPSFREEELVTKRKALSTQATPFDPLGMICLLLLPAKILMSGTHECTAKWDGVLPDSFQLNWKEILSWISFDKAIFMIEENERQLSGYLSQFHNLWLKGCAIILLFFFLHQPVRGQLHDLTASQHPQGRTRWRADPGGRERAGQGQFGGNVAECLCEERRWPNSVRSGMAR